MDINPELLERYLAGTATPGEQQQVEAWLKENNITREQLVQMLNLPEGVKLMLRQDVAGDWSKVREQLPKRKQVWLVPALRVAASVILAIGIVYYLMRPWETQTFAFTNHSSAPKEIILPDSSRVFLHQFASISYTEAFAEQRNVSMKGEAFFDVQRDPLHPFSIAIGQSKVVVLGTSFNIDDDTTRLEVTVATGKVSVESPQHESVVLEKGETGTYDKSTLLLSKANNEDLNFDAWRTRVLQFNDTPIEKALADVGEYFDVKIQVVRKGNAPVTYTSYFENPQIVDVLTEMKEVLGIEYQEKGKDIIVTIP